MENQTRLKLRISRMFRSSFGSCKSRNLLDIIERPVFLPHNRQHYQLMELFSPKPRPFPSICRPRCSETELFPRRKVSDRNSLLAPADTDGRKCPPVSPISPLNTFFGFQQLESKPKKKKLTKKKKKTTHLRKKVSFESFDNYYDLFSSDDDDSEVEDDDETTLFSSKSLSSDSSDSFRRNKARYRRRRAAKKETETGVMPLQGKVKDSFAVVKRSSDPYNDFRSSMLEMILEKQIFGARDLENLLQTFLSLNSYHHHRVITEVFTEIWEALFSN